MIIARHTVTEQRPLNTMLLPGQWGCWCDDPGGVGVAPCSQTARAAQWRDQVRHVQEGRGSGGPSGCRGRRENTGQQKFQGTKHSKYIIILVWIIVASNYRYILPNYGNNLSSIIVTEIQITVPSSLDHTRHNNYG